MTLVPDPSQTYSYLARLIASNFLAGEEFLVCQPSGPSRKVRFDQNLSTGTALV